MQERFVAEPLDAKTGQGHLKSAGVDELKNQAGRKAVK